MTLQPPHTLESRRLLLRLVRETDIPDLLEVNGDDEVTRFLPYPSWLSLEDGQALFDRMNSLMAAEETLQFVVVDRASARAIGTCLLFHHEQPSARAEIGYVMGRAHWGKGLMHEALTSLIAFAFDACQLRRLEAEVNPQNLASLRLLHKLGFTREGLLRQRWAAKGDPYDTHIFGLLRDEWSVTPPSSSCMPPQDKH